jgi:hypothetical protein
MIHFDFIVDDIDASNIFECIQAEISKCLMRKLRSNTTPEESDWYDAHAKYLEGLKLKMKNKLIKGGTDGN